MIKRISITVSGRVQGVGFRYFVQKNAAALRLVGFVKNDGDDKVEIVAEGEKDKLELLLEKCKKGPVFSHVENIVYDFEEAAGRFNGFEIK